MVLMLFFDDVYFRYKFPNGSWQSKSVICMPRLAAYALIASLCDSPSALCESDTRM